jgi:hypothetical protein
MPTKGPIKYENRVIYKAPASLLLYYQNFVTNWKKNKSTIRITSLTQLFDVRITMQKTFSDFFKPEQSDPVLAAYDEWSKKYASNPIQGMTDEGVAQLNIWITNYLSKLIILIDWTEIVKTQVFPKK